MRKPAISGRREIYLSPVDVREGGAGPGEMVWLPQGETVPAGDATWTFVGFRMESHDAMRVSADIDVTRGGRTTRISPALVADAQGMHPIPAEVPGLGEVVVGHIDADHKRVAISPPGAGGAGLAVFEFSTKPLVNLVWVGALLTLLGAVLAGVRRALEVMPRARARTAPTSGVEVG